MEDREVKSYRSVLLTAFGGCDKLRIVQRTLPEIVKGDVVVQMKACGVNFSDICVRQGIYSLNNTQPPFVMGLEGAGIITEVAEGVTELKVGDRVMCWSFRYGMWSEYVSVPSNQCYLMPESMTFEEAAAIPINYVTAYQAVIGFGGLAPGQKILIQSASGGVGWAATQIARSVGDVTIFGTASASKHPEIRNNGVTHPIDYRNSDFVEEVLHISPSGVNVILDCLSGNDFMRSRQILKHMGKLVHIGVSNMIIGENKSLLQMLKVWWQVKNISIADISNRNHAICGLNIASLYEEQPETFRYAIQQIVKLYSEGKIKPRIDSMWSFEQAAKAVEHMMKRKNIGKMILVPFDSSKNST